MQPGARRRSGRCLNELARLADYLENAEKLAEQVNRAGLSDHPAGHGGARSQKATVVVPQFTPLFEGAGAELPVLTRIVIGAGELMQRYWWLLLLAMVGLWWLGRR
jgi:general secretion pathway protein F